ncbi:MAG: thiamine pyrophosphate-dependent enzyme [bacterium]|jgi:pyruvate ferredoxin oxidoreductase beta subunit
MVIKLREISKKKPLFTGGHRLCAGCGAAVIARQVMNMVDEPVVIGNGTGCLEVTTSIYPFSSWNVSWIHSAFPNTASTIAGVESAWRALRDFGEMKDNYRFIAFAGDGGTYDIGLQALSGAIERGHRFLYVCYNNQAYMNTGYQRSGATPASSWSSTTPVGTKQKGKPGRSKDLTAITAAHKIPYVAQASPGFWNDLMLKVERALQIDGPSFINVIQPCIPGWGILPRDSMRLAKLAVDTCYWPLYEIIDGRECTINYHPKQKLPLTEFLSLQKRFKHLLKDENKALLEELQAEVDTDWEMLMMRCVGSLR